MYTLAEIYKKTYAQHLIEAKRLSGKVCFDLLPDEMPIYRCCAFNQRRML